MQTTNRQGWLRGLWCGVGILALIISTGCQVDIGGQTLPSPYYLKDDVQYYAPGPEFLLSKEAAAIKASKVQQALQAVGPPAP